MENCGHYTRGCKFISPCCDKTVNCRICHDESSDHELNRFEVSKISCNFCDKIQDISNKCIDCGEKFANYFCSICRLYDYSETKSYYHCDRCGICRVGPIDTVFHCDECNMCYSITLKNNHTCKKELFMTDCCICLNDLFTSRESCIILKCSHVIHNSCANQWLNKNIGCPLCRKTMLDSDTEKKYIEYMDELIKNNPIENSIKINIRCNDCLDQDEIDFHPIGQKCGNCGSYNTSY